ncbi:hypothetical protein HYS31_06195 [Candidatus Woesearchaeota archaeon]|nr:hypothetical protein [Candidatus Woesearchaeota archaeon]
MNKKDIAFYAVILILLVLLIWQWLAKNKAMIQLDALQKANAQLRQLSGIGDLKSAHWHADVKVYVDGKALDFSQPRYQLATSFIHFEEGIGDVVHIHATGLTAGHLFESLGIDFNSNCMLIDAQSYCNDVRNKLKFYVNGKLNDDFDNYAMQDLDKILVSYGSEDESGIKKQLDSVTDLAKKYSKK